MNRRTGLRQRGFLLEVPLLMTVAAVVVALLFPRLSGWQANSVLVIAAGIWLAGLYYLLILPGWQPGQSHRFPRGRMVVFAVAAALVLILTGSALD